MQYSNLIIPLTYFINVIIIAIMFFFKKRVHSFENRAYAILILVSLLEGMSEIISFYVLLNYGYDNIVYSICCKLILISYPLWVINFLLYNTIITFDLNILEKQKKSKIILNTFLIIEFIISVVIAILPISYSFVDGLVIPLGYATMVVYLICGIGDLLVVILFFRSLKKGFNTKFIPAICLFFLGFIIVLFQLKNPEYLLIGALLSLITFIMYHTIENPDVKMLETVEIAKTQAEKANKAKTDFLSSMSHEIRTPLNAIVGFSNSLIENPNIPEDVKGDVNDILAASDNLLEIVNGVLDISKIEANKIEIIDKEYDTKKLFNELSNLTKVRIGEKPIEFVTKIDESMPRVLYGDSTRVKQIIVNLLTNAAKYTDEGKIKFNVQSVIKDDICRMIISVEDTGRGIKKEAIDKLFTKFERLEEDRNTTIEGTGLGLAITKKLLELMNGRIVVQSEHGKGSKFTATIDQKIVKNPTINLENEIEKVEVFDLSNYKVLVVDDNKLNIKVAERLLSPYKLNVESVTSGFETIEKLKNQSKYDLILMDDMMPKLSGTQTLNEIKKLNLFDGPIIALTANALTGMKEKYLESGFNDYLAKPIEKEELNRILKQYLDKNDSKVNSYDIINNESSAVNNTKLLEENGVDVSKGLELLGDIDMYNDTMKDFLKEIKEKYPKTVEYKNLKDMPNYAILVHSIKSDSKYLGFTKLAEIAYEHELKSKANDIKYVEDNFETLQKELARIITVIKEYLKEE